jgi:hypothetical protein
MATPHAIQTIQSLIFQYGPDQDLQTVLEKEIFKYERKMYLDAFKTDVEDMGEETLEHILADANTPTDILDIVTNEIKHRPRRLAIQSALLERACKGGGAHNGNKTFEENTPEFKQKQLSILEVEETREESDIITLLNALYSGDDRLTKFDKIMIGITLGRVLSTWKKPLRPYIASVRFSKQDTLCSLYHFKCLSHKTVGNVQLYLMDGIMKNFKSLVEQCTLQDLNSLIRIQCMCRTVDLELARILRTRIEILCSSHPDFANLLEDLNAIT